MATKRRVHPKKRSAKKPAARVAYRPGGSPPTTVPAAYSREPAIIADTATCLPPDAVLFDAAEERVLCTARELIGQPDVPHGTSNEDDFEPARPLGLTQFVLTPAQLRGVWVAVAVLTVVTAISIGLAGT